MTNNLPTIVCGVGRCGSSMVMQMLVSGGMQPTGTATWPMLEDVAATSLPAETDWLRGLTTKNVVKILNPDYFFPPEWFRCRAIWVDRDIDQQSASWVKFGTAAQTHLKDLPKLKRSHIKAIIRKRTRDGVEIMREVAVPELFRVRFEDILTEPRYLAECFAATIGLDLDVGKMARAVKDRDPRCLGGFLENYNRVPGSLGAA